MTTPAWTELLDDPHADPIAVRTSLANIARANRWFGGTAAVVHGVERLLSTGPKSEVWSPGGFGGPSAAAPRTSDLGPRTTELTILDIGTGAGDIPEALRRWGTSSGIRVRTAGLERLRPAARLARAPALPMTLGCATALPFRTGGVDVVTISQVLHHFPPEAAVRLLAEGARVARRGVVVADLFRSRMAAALFGIGARVLGFDAHTVEDGITSVGRGYAPEELVALCRRAGIAGTVAVRPGWRIVAWGRRA
jgi:2-polyprenyl-3-methyl-5-hydroxy-6-metoxy-1,4-benzoquinol methylase